jgi:hypothetical protein
MGIASINKFTGQISTDINKASSVDVAITQNFDVLSRSDCLLPMRGMEEMTQTGFYITDFIYGNFGTGIGTNVLGYGVQSGETINGEPELYKISDTLPGTTWATALTTTGTPADDRNQAGTIFNNLFHLHKGYIYHAAGTAYIGTIGNIETTGQGATWSPRAKNVSFTSFANGITHSKDGLMYTAYSNGSDSSAQSYIAQITNNSTIDEDAFALPVGHTATSVSEYRDYVATALRGASSVGKSTVILWDRDPTNTLASESVDWGDGQLNVIEQIDQTLIGVSISGTSSFDLYPKVTIKAWAGGEPVVIDTLTTGNTSVSLSTKKYKYNNVLYFALKANINGADRYSLFSVGKNKNGQFVVNGDLRVNNEVAPTSIDGFTRVGDVWYTSLNSGTVTRTATTYNVNSIYESLNNPNMPEADRHSKKQLMGVQVVYDPLPVGAQVSVAYRTDNSGTYTTILDDTTTGSKQMYNTKTFDGVNYGEFNHGYDYSFRILSSGGAVVRSLTYKYQVSNTQIDG